MRRPVPNYSSAAKFFHWSIALIVLVMLPSGYFLDKLSSSYKSLAYLLHKSFGLTVLFMMIFRLLWIHHQGRPALPLLMPRWEKCLAYCVQASLYCFVILMPLCGWVMSVAANRAPNYFGLFHLPLPGIYPDRHLADLMFQAHRSLAWIIIGLLILHVVGALKHHFIDKDSVLLNMLPSGRKFRKARSNGEERFDQRRNRFYY